MSSPDAQLLDLSRRTAVYVHLVRHAREKPDKVAIIDAESTTTYAELERRTNNLAHHLRRSGVERGDRVAVMMRNCVTFPEVMVAAHKIGAVVVPVNFRLAPPEVRYQLDNCEPKVLVTDPESRGAVPHDAEVPLHLTTGPTRDGLQGTEPWLDEGSGELPLTEFSPDDLAFIMYTSGTTGRPKGAMLTHQSSWVHTTAWVGDSSAHADDVWMNGVPMFHSAGIAGMLPMFQLGGTYVVSPSTPFSAAESIDLLARHGVTLCAFVPTQWEEICRSESVDRIDTTVLRRLMWGGAQAPLDVLELMAATFPNAAVVNSYGQTEMGPTTTWLQGEDSISKMGSVGRPTSVVEMRLIDDAGDPVPTGTVGEIVYRGPTVMAGYWRDERATAEAFAGGWFHSGDLGRRDEEGHVYVVDRKKDMIITGGENVYPAEVEAVIRQLDGVIDVAVVGAPHPRWHETPVAFVVVDDAFDRDPQRVIDHCRAQLASYKKPSEIVFIADLPRNSTGKVLKRTLREHASTPVSAAAQKG